MCRDQPSSTRDAQAALTHTATKLAGGPYGFPGQLDRYLPTPMDLLSYALWGITGKCIQLQRVGKD